MDGSGCRDTLIATGGGLIRDSLGRCLLVFTCDLGKCSITRTEIKATLVGLHFAWDAGHRKVFLQLDSMTARLILSREGESSHQHAHKIFRFWELLNRDWIMTKGGEYLNGSIFKYLNGLNMDQH
ncbi:hypothetical protein LINPERPRIM_LOCUS4998 [Linum perenne]